MQKPNYLYNELIEKNNDLKKYNSFLQKISPTLTLELLIEIMLKKKPKIRIMDVGCGNAGALTELKQKYKNKIHCIGLDLIEFESKIDEKIIRDALTTNFPKKIDLIISFRTLHLIGNIKKILEKTTVSLVVGGLAIYSIRIRNGLDFTGVINSIDEDFLSKIVADGVFNGCEVRGEVVSVSGLIQGFNLFVKKLG